MLNMAQNESAPGDSQPSGETGEGFSQFVTRILRQLTASSWLPSTMLVGNLILILQLHSQHNFSFSEAITQLAKSPLGLAVVIIIAVTVVSVMTQAFQFRIVRLLEGYWASNRILGLLSTLQTNRNIRRQERLEARYHAYIKGTFELAKSRMLQSDDIPTEVIDAMEEIIVDGGIKKSYSPEIMGEVKDALRNWREFAPPDLLRRMDATRVALEEYPVRSRILPTRIGNILTSDGDIVENHRDRLGSKGLLPSRLQKEYDLFQSRLEMYGLLAFFFFGLALVSLIAFLPEKNIIAIVAFPVTYLALAGVSYQSAVATARRYISTVPRTLVNDPH